MNATVLENCKRALPAWAELTVDEVDFADPKGFSSFTMAVQPRRPVEPPATLYRRLAGKENAILDYAQERDVFLTLGREQIAAHCYHYELDYRLEAFYHGRTLTRLDLKEPQNLKGIADELFKLHELQPDNLPEGSFFDLLHARWAPLVERVLLEQRHLLPKNEQSLCDELGDVTSPDTIRKVRRCLPDGPLTFCHNDTYHGNIMKLRDGRIRLLDFEFSCMGHKAFDFSNLFAETVMRHKLPDYPFFSIAEPEYSERDISTLVGFYLDNANDLSSTERNSEHDRLVGQTQDMILLSDYMYTMAAIPLAVEPIQKIRFIPYALARFRRFLESFESRQTR